MHSKLLKEIAHDYLVPFFSGAYLEDDRVASDANDELTSFNNPNRISFKVEKNDDYRLSIYRPQPFVIEQRAGYVVREIEVVRAFVDVLGTMSNELDGHLKRDLLSTFERRVVAKSLGSSANYVEETILSAIDQLAKISNRSYEGAPIVTSMGFKHLTQGDDAPRMDEINANDFGLVLSNGLDTLLEYDFHGKFITETLLSIPDDSDGYYAPLRHAATARWTTQDPRRRRVAIVLNRRGEILVFRDGQLLFTRRAGRWSFLTHRPIVTQMGKAPDRKIRRALYDTALDASFARTGACLGLVAPAHSADWTDVVVNKDDHLTENKSIKARTINLIIKNKKFQDIDRRLRLEMASIDGAILVSHEGVVLTVGAILKIPGGSLGRREARGSQKSCRAWTRNQGFSRWWYLRV